MVGPRPHDPLVVLPKFTHVGLPHDSLMDIPDGPLMDNPCIIWTLGCSSARDYAAGGEGGTTLGE